MPLFSDWQVPGRCGQEGEGDGEGYGGGGTALRPHGQVSKDNCKGYPLIDLD